LIEGSKSEPQIIEFLNSVKPIIQDIPMQCGEYSITELAQYVSMSVEALIMAGREIQRQIERGNVTIDQLERLQLIIDVLEQKM